MGGEFTYPNQNGIQNGFGNHSQAGQDSPKKQDTQMAKTASVCSLSSLTSVLAVKLP